nr:heavy metal translocating P-type ATPase metal-binding domain-containing protein [Hymenobacter nitidus]
MACAHCGDDCPAEPVRLAARPALPFCCQGCKAVYELLDASNLCTYYRLDEKPGQKVKTVELPGRFDYLDLESVQSQLLTFQSPTLHRLTFTIPQMHCASCIWLLENLFKLNPGISASRVNFLRKELTVSYQPATTSLKDVVTLLAAINYEPQITLAELGAQPHHAGRRLTYQLGLAAFAFGNVMLMAFPDYFSFTEQLQSLFGRFFGWLSFALAVPVLLVSARDFYFSAWQGLRQRYINLDFPISLGLTALFTTSVFDIATGRGPGYFDSFTGLVFFMLIGKWVQQRTYDALRFDRDFTSYFPVAVTLLTKEGEQSVSVKELKAGQRIRVRHQEIIPADAVLLRGAGQIDYSFVSGESMPVSKQAGDIVYAGGRQVGEAVELEVVREVSQGYLTQLWNNPAFQKEGKPTLETYANKVGRYFVAVTLLLAVGAVLYWYPRNPQMALRACTSVLVIACPCALSLATPFALGAALRVLGRRKLYLKNAAVVETLGRADTLVFDKTGTLTDTHRALVSFHGLTLSPEDEQRVAALAAQSTHPLSQRLADQLGASPLRVESYAEVLGQGLCGRVAGRDVRLGSAAFVDLPAAAPHGERQARVYVALDGLVEGWYEVSSEYRPHLNGLLQELSKTYTLALLTGDNDADEPRLRQLFGPAAELRFNQSPLDKLSFVETQQRQGRRVVMVGDGLNDAGALQRADTGLALSETLTNFSPACDAILDAGSFGQLSTFLWFSQDCLQIVLATFVLSFCYNGIGLGLAVQGRFTPIVSAILMPISSLSVMVFATLLVRYAAYRRGL